MKTLEEETINCLNKLLSKYSLKITNDTYKVCDINGYQLDDEITNGLICIWESIDEMLFDSSCSLFNKLNHYYNAYIQPNTKRNKTLKRYKRYAAAYDSIKHLKNISCLEELIINLNLRGIF